MLRSVVRMTAGLRVEDTKSILDPGRPAYHTQEPNGNTSATAVTRIFYFYHKPAVVPLKKFEDIAWIHVKHSRRDLGPKRFAAGYD